MIYEPGQVEQLLGISSEVLQSWTHELATFLSAAPSQSETATGERRYTEADLVLLCRAQVLLWEQRTFEQVRQVLAAPAPAQALQGVQLEAAPLAALPGDTQPAASSAEPFGPFSALAIARQYRSLRDRVRQALQQPDADVEGAQGQAAAQSIGSFLAGVTLAWLGQYLMLTREPLLDIDLSHKLNEQFAIGVPNPDNVLLAAVLLLISWVLLARGASPLRLSPLPPSDRSIPKLGRRSSARSVYAPLVAAALCFALLTRQLAGAQYSRGLVLLWIVAPALILLAALAIDRRASVRVAPNLELYDLLLMLGIVLAGIGIGAYQLDRLPGTMIGDEGAFFETARSIALGKYQASIFSYGVYSYPILGSIYQAWMLQLFGPTLWAWRFGSVLAGVLALPPTYLLAHELLGRRVAVVAGVVMLVTPYFIAFERLGYNNSQSIAPVTLSLYLLYVGLKHGSALYLALSGVVAGLGFYTYTAGRLALFVGGLFLANLLATWLVRRTVGRVRESEPAGVAGSPRKLAALGGIFLLACSVTALPQLVYSSALDPSATSYKMVESLLANVEYARNFFPEDQLYHDRPPIQLGGETFFYRADLYAKLFVRGIARSLLAFAHDQLVSDHYIKSALAGPITAVFFFFGVVVALSNLKHMGIALLALWFFGGLVALSIIHAFPPRYQHIVPIIPAMSIFTALGIVTCAESIGGEFGVWRRHIAHLLVALVVIFATFSGLRNYYVDVQAFYQPTLPNVALTTMLRTDTPRRMVYVADDPNEANFIPWLARNVTADTTLQSLAPADVTPDRLHLDPGRSYIFFFHEQDRPIVVPFLEHTLSTPIEPQAYRDSAGNIVGLVVAFNS